MFRSKREKLLARLEKLLPTDLKTGNPIGGQVTAAKVRYLRRSPDLPDAKPAKPKPAPAPAKALTAADKAAAKKKALLEVARWRKQRGDRLDPEHLAALKEAGEAWAPESCPKEPA